MRAELSRERRELPWEAVTKNYVFDTAQGRRSLADLFEGRSQLVVYHFMFAPDWEQGCKSCSFWADNYNGIVPHLNQRDVTLVAVSRAPLAKLQAFAQRLGWTFNWVSALGSDFNFDYQASIDPKDVDQPAVYNYQLMKFPASERPGFSVFHRAATGRICHTHSCYARGLDMMNTAYHILDLVPKGRDEGGLPATMAWVRHRDQYGSPAPGTVVAEQFAVKPLIHF